jgi:transposase
MKGLEFEQGMGQETFEQYLSHLEDLTERIKRMEMRIGEVARVSSEYSSGGKRNRGGITKTGNTHIRKLLTESAWHYPRPVMAGRRLSERRAGTGRTRR